METPVTLFPDTDAERRKLLEEKAEVLEEYDRLKERVSIYETEGFGLFRDRVLEPLLDQLAHQFAGMDPQEDSRAWDRLKGDYDRVFALVHHGKAEREALDDDALVLHVYPFGGLEKGTEMLQQMADGHWPRIEYH